jgi:cell division protein FtsQ
VLPFPRRWRRQSAFERWLPSSRSLIVGAALVALAAGAYLAARETSLFAVREINVEGVPAPLADRVRTTLAPLLGTSLVVFSSSAADRRLAAIPEIATARYDRDFPHTLRVLVHAEQPVAVLRQGTDAWLVSASVRVLRELVVRPYPPLPRIWIPRSVDATIGSTLGGLQAEAVRAVTPLRRIGFPATVRTVVANEGELTLVVGSGLEVRLGDAGDLALKLAIATRLLPRAGDARYVDVAVPERPVIGYKTVSSNSQVEG